MLHSLRLATAEPYSDAVQTNVVINYNHVPAALVGKGAFFPPLDIPVSSFLKFPMHALCGCAGDQNATVAWASIPPEDQLQPLSIQFIRAFTLPPPDKLATFLASSQPSGTNAVLVSGLHFPLAIIAVWEVWMRILGLDDEEPPFPSTDNDDENIPTADIITHITEGKHASNYLEKDGCSVSVATEGERADSLPEDELEAAAGLSSNSDSGSGSNFEEPENDKPSSLIPTVTQGQSVRVQKPRDLSYLNWFWDD